MTSRTATGIVHKALSIVRPQFRLDYGGGIHGLPHWSRVWYHGQILAKQSDVNPSILAWFAYLHDSQRHHDGRDAKHGHRAADFATRQRRDGMIVELSDIEFEHLCEAMRLHSDGHTESDPAITACWDADRLDLYRVGIVPRAHRLCTPHARHLATIEAAMRMSRSRKRTTAAAATYDSTGSQAAYAALAPVLALRCWVGSVMGEVMPNLSPPPTQELSIPRSPIWYKVLGMLQQNWCVLVEWRDFSEALFCDDRGGVFDRLCFTSTREAERALRTNGFSALSKNPQFKRVSGGPHFPLTEGGMHGPVYSSGEYWEGPLPTLDCLNAPRVRKEPSNNLGRFVEAQTSVYSRVLRELRSEQKVTHWMWFIFPQVAGLGHSPMARQFALRSVEEAREYLVHPVLGPRLRECFQCILAVEGRTANDILGSPDDLKLRSSATLFAAAAPQELLFSEALQKFYGGPDLKTLKILGLTPSESQ